MNPRQSMRTHEGMTADERLSMRADVARIVGDLELETMDSNDRFHDLRGAILDLAQDLRFGADMKPKYLREALSKAAWKAYGIYNDSRGDDMGHDEYGNRELGVERDITDPEVRSALFLAVRKLDEAAGYVMVTDTAYAESFARASREIRVLLGVRSDECADDPRAMAQRP